MINCRSFVNLSRGDKYEWVIRYCGSGMTEEQIDNWLVIYGEKK
ncbi:hypothetical protein phiA047_0149 [Aeromonas phage phiA047]|nr:hypothetical protein phiA047_0149 [Aeromonas phage phiA047]